jgi:hypothetical protein
MMHVWLAAQFFVLFGDQKCVVVASRVRYLIKFLHLWILRAEIYIHFFCPRRRPWTLVWRKCVCVCVYVCVCGGGGRRTVAMLVFISINLRNFYSRFCAQQYIITNFLAKDPSGLLRTEFWDLIYKVRRYELPQFVSPFINQHMCTTLCISNHIAVTDPTCFGVCRHHHQGDQYHCKFFAVHQMIMAHHRLCRPNILSATHEAVNRSLYISTHAHSPKQVRIKGNFIRLFN